MRYGAAILATVVAVAACSPTDEAPRSRPGAATMGSRQPGVSCGELDEFIQRVRRGYYPQRSVDLSLIPHEPNYIGSPLEPAHTGPYDFLAEVPLVFYGPGYIERTGSVDDVTTMADIAPTVARLIGFSDFDAPDGAVLTSGMAEPERRPRLVVTVVWDGGGWNTLNEHPNAWPFLKEMMARGVSFDKATIGSTPSNTPPIHTTLGTGAFPRRHGIPNVTMVEPGGSFIQTMAGNSPEHIELPTLADLYDKAMDNRPLVGVIATVNWHLGMMSRGALHPGGDRDVAALFTSDGTTFGDDAIYEIADGLADPQGFEAGVEKLDRSDGQRDGRWARHELDDSQVRYALPVTAAWMGARLRTAIDRYGFGRDDAPDLLYTNFKSIDDTGHQWGMASAQMRAAIAATDTELKNLVAHLDAEVGRRRWVVIVTADHGTMPFPNESGGWAISGGELLADLNRAFESDGEPFFARMTGAGIFLNDEEVETSGLDLSEVGDWLLGYTAADNLESGNRVPTYYEDKIDVPLFDAVLAGRTVVARECQ